MSYEKGVTLDFYNFEGKYKCLLCPEKRLTSEKSLNEHIISKTHIKRLKAHFENSAVTK